MEGILNDYCEYIVYETYQGHAKAWPVFIQ